jgi:hypothetical protein
MKTLRSNRFSLLILAAVCVTGLVLYRWANPPYLPVVGNYARKLPAYSENLSIKADGTFQQMIKGDNNRTFSIHGNWVQGASIITFRPFLMGFDPETGRPLSPPKEFSQVGINIGHDSLYLDRAPAWAKVDLKGSVP